MCTVRRKHQHSLALCGSRALHHPSASGSSPLSLNLERQRVTGTNPSSSVWDDVSVRALLHHTFVPSSSQSHDKVGNELSHPSALWVPVCLCRGNKVIALLLQNGVSQSRWWEIGQRSVVVVRKSTFCTSGFFGCIVDLINNKRRKPSFLQSVFHLRAGPWKPKIALNPSEHSKRKTWSEYWNESVKIAAKLEVELTPDANSTT